MTRFLSSNLSSGATWNRLNFFFGRTPAKGELGCEVSVKDKKPKAPPISASIRTFLFYKKIAPFCQA